ncbi:phospholipase A [Castellaniella sp. S9]|uniref:phospholipase A n=1 Tax=Castellaniella sp. S9 TaxID=2993652 RepID=UPI0022B3F2AB|nr:phospholipase A [Castellaniella sp. S9]
MIHPPLRKLFRRLVPLWLAAASLPAAHAGIVYRLTQPSVQAGQAIQLQGVIFNDTGNALTVVPPATLEAGLQDGAGRSRSLRFTLSSPPDTIVLPANTFAQIAWTATAPEGASGLRRLRIEGQPDSALALDVVDGGSGRGGAKLVAGAGAMATAAAAAAESGSGSGSGIAEGEPSPFDTFRNAISPYEPIYFIVGNRDGADARFQLSFKYRLLSPEDPAKAGFMDNWYFGYTQTSLWDLHSDSIPFVDTSYNPSLFWNKDVLWESRSHDWSVGLNAGVEHLSNGKNDDDSRSLNDLYVQPAFNYRFEGGSQLSFTPRFKYYFSTDRDMRYPDYLGRIDWKLRWAQDDSWALSGLYRQGSEGRNAVQLEAAWPLRHTFLHMNGYLYAQYFRGYGETLLGYQQKASPVVRFGIALVP